MKSEQTFSAQQQHCKRPRNENKQNRPSDNGARRNALSVAVFCEFFLVIQLAVSSSRFLFASQNFSALFA